MKITIAVILSLISASVISAEIPKTVGTVVGIKTGDTEKDRFYSERLHFCLFENGENDLLYVGTKFGMWSNGKFDLSINDKKVFSGEVPHMVYGGTFVELGNVIDQQPKSNIGLHITKIKGWFK